MPRLRMPKLARKGTFVAVSELGVSFLGQSVQSRITNRSVREYGHPVVNDNVSPVILTPVERKNKWTLQPQLLSFK